MKKILSMVVLLFMLVISTGVSFAQDKVVEIKMNIGSKKALVNNATKVTWGPIVVNNSIVIPVNIISDSIGAKYVLDKNTGICKITYINKKIEISTKSTYASVDGKKIKLKLKPIIKNGMLFFPLSGVIDIFGASLDYNYKTKSIKIKINIGGESDTQDEKTTMDNINKIFQNITKSKIGDSFYNWEINLPAGCIITEKDSSGYYTVISDKNKEYSYSVVVYPVDDNADEIYAMDKIKANFEDDETVITEDYIQKDGYNWAKLISQYDSGEYIADVISTVKDHKLYKLNLFATKKSYYDQTKQQNYQDIINSFKLSFDKVSSDVDDINEVVDGLYNYESENYGWSIKVPYDLQDIYEQNNSVNFYSFDITQTKNLEIQLSSINDNETLEEVANNDIKEIKDQINEKYITKLELQDYNINDIPAKSIICEFGTSKKKSVTYGVYLVYNNIKYYLSYMDTKENFDKQGTKDICDKIFKSFIPSNKTFSNKINNSGDLLKDKTRQYKNNEYKWSIEYPATWKVSEDKESDGVSVIDPTEFMSIEFLSDDNMSYSKYVQNLEYTLEQSKETNEDFEMTSSQNIEFNELTGKKWVYKYSYDGELCNFEDYILTKDNVQYLIEVTYPEVVNTEANRLKIQKIVDSFKANK